MTQQTGQQITKILILHNISRSTTKQTMKLEIFGMIIIFKKKSYAKCGEEASSRPFYQTSKLSIYLDQ